MAILLLGGTITPALSQSSSDSQIVINEIELNPSGSDAGIGVGGSGNESKSVEGTSGSQEYVELYNPTLQSIDIGGWSLMPTTSWKSYEIPVNTVIEPKSFLAFTHVNFWFNDFGDSISLIDNTGDVIDSTPLLVDKDDDGKSWQRIIDGLDSNSLTDWELKTMSPSSSNGSITEIETDSFTLTAQTDNTSYQFGDYLTISGTVSEKLFVEKPFFTPEIIKLSIKGPSYFKNIAIFPDRDLNFSTTLGLQEVLGFKIGTYDVEIVYGENIIETNFTINADLEVSQSEIEAETLNIFTDKESYIPGQTVTVSAQTNSLIQYGGLDYTVTNPEGKVIFEGTIFQNSEFSIVHQQGGGELFPFSTQLFMQTVNPVYGTYEIDGVYKSQNPRYYSSDDVITAKSSFEVVPDLKEDVPISLSTDKDVYSVGDTIKVTGRSNVVWTEDLELSVQQTSIYARTTSTSSDNIGAAIGPFSLKESVRLDGDGRFSFEFDLIVDSRLQENNENKYGDYKITVSEYFGQTSKIIRVVEDPSSFIDERTPLGLKTDKPEYVLGTAVKIIGNVMDYEHKISNNMRNTVEVSIVDETGKKLMYQDRTTSANDYGKSPNAPLVMTAIPDSVGSFQIGFVLHPIQFDYGVYTVIATHPYSNTVESVQFEIKSAQDEIVPVKESEEPITLKLCKSNNAYVKDILNDLRSIGRGEIPPSMESVDCDDKNTFKIGDKLVVTGKVIPKAMTTLDQSSSNPSGNTQTGHSYSTNYAQSVMNYVEVTIPYPKSMTVSGSASVKTIPDEGENYTGGGGSGGGGGYYEDEDGNIIRGDEDKNQSDEDRRTGYDGQAVLKNQKLLLTGLKLKAYPDDEGNFAGIFELRKGIFADGTYLVRANYFGYNTEQGVRVIDESIQAGSKPEIILNLEKSEFIPGQTVKISGKIENIYYFDSVSIKIESPDVSKINCLQGQQCGFGSTEKKLRVEEGVNGAQFFWNYKIPDSDASVGEYKIIVDTHFGLAEKRFYVLSKSEIIENVIPETVTPETAESILISKKIIDKFNRISDDKIPIILTEKSTDDLTLEPRVIQGSLFTSARGEESDVNLRITTSDGQCVIGQSSDCLVTESTRKPGAIYSIVTIDDINYKIRYSGDDVRLEKFSIVPEDSNSKINIDNWNVEILKDEQPSRFYYKVSYVALE
ncbi:lamin tail domain-containing protein [Candidatus Nitrosopelagicus sp.]|nr:lamin tail domain-containing protein [Candidatus Nitrosopelagicus sp.]